MIYSPAVCSHCNSNEKKCIHSREKQIYSSAVLYNGNFGEQQDVLIHKNIYSSYVTPGSFNEKEDILTQQKNMQSLFYPIELSMTNKYIPIDKHAILNHWFSHCNFNERKIPIHKRLIHCFLIEI